MTSATMNLIILVFLALSIVIFAAANPLSRLIAPGFSPSQISIMVNLLRIMLAAQVFFSISGFLTGIIQSHQRFLIPALAPVAYNLGIIGGIVFLSPALGIYGPAAGVVIGAILHMLIQLPLAYRLGFRFQPLFDFRLPGVLEVGSLMPPPGFSLGYRPSRTICRRYFSFITLSGFFVPAQRCPPAFYHSHLFVWSHYQPSRLSCPGQRSQRERSDQISSDLGFLTFTNCLYRSSCQHTIYYFAYSHCSSCLRS